MAGSSLRSDAASRGRSSDSSQATKRDMWIADAVPGAVVEDQAVLKDLDKRGALVLGRQRDVQRPLCHRRADVATHLDRQRIPEPPHTHPLDGQMAQVLLALGIGNMPGPGRQGGRGMETVVHVQVPAVECASAAHSLLRRGDAPRSAGHNGSAGRATSQVSRRAGFRRWPPCAGALPPPPSGNAPGSMPRSPPHPTRTWTATAPDHRAR